MMQFAAENPILTLVLCIIGGAVLTCVIAGTAGLGAGSLMANILYGTLGGAIGAVIGTFLVGGFSPGKPGEPGSPSGDEGRTAYSLVVHMEQDRLKMKLVDTQSSTPRRYETAKGETLEESISRMKKDIGSKDIEVAVEFQTSVPQALRDSVIEELRNQNFLCRF